MTVRVMLVDDSAVIRGLIARALEFDPDLSIVMTAANGRMAIQLVEQAAPDVIILDIEMPEMDGITALPELLRLSPRSKIIMASTLTVRNAGISMEALAKGASDYVAKPSAREKGELDQFYRELRDKVRVFGGLPMTEPLSAPVAQVVAAPVAQAPRTSPKGPIVIQPARQKPVQALAIASSTGGPQALLALVAGLQGRLTHLPIFITQHMPPTFTTILAEQLTKAAGRPCTEAVHGEHAVADHIYVAPGNFHLIPKREGAHVILQLTQDAPVNFCRPAADPMIEALSGIYGEGLLTVVLTGMGQDGMHGAEEAYRRGGSVIAQDEKTSVVWGMPKATAEANICEAVLPLPDIAPYIIKRSGG